MTLVYLGVALVVALDLGDDEADQFVGIDGR